MQNKNQFEIILHVGRVASLQSWVLKNHITVKPLQMNVLFLTTLPILKARNSPYMLYYLKLLFVLHSSEVIFLFLIHSPPQRLSHSTGEKPREKSATRFHCEQREPPRRRVFLIKKSNQKAIEIEIVFFITLGIPRDAYWIISFMLHISAITSPTN